MPDISENGRQIGEKLFILLDKPQQKALIQYVLDRKNKLTDTSAPVRIVPKYQQSQNLEVPPFTEIQIDDLYFCLEERTVLVRGQEIPLTAREFNIFHLLIPNCRRVITFEVISERVWGCDYETTTPKAIRDLMSRIR